jgi:hypothetical protein
MAQIFMRIEHLYHPKWEILRKVVRGTKELMELIGTEGSSLSSLSSFLFPE